MARSQQNDESCAELATATVAAAEGVPLSIRAAGPLAAVIVVVARFAFRRAAATVVVPVAETTAASSILGAGAARIDAAALAGLTTPILAAPLVLLFLFLPFAAPTEIRTTLAVAATGVTCQATPFDEDIVFGRKPQVSPGKRNQGKSRSGHVPQRGPAVAQSGYQAGPVVEPAFVHAGLSSSLFQTRRASRIRVAATTCQYAIKE